MKTLQGGIDVEGIKRCYLEGAIAKAKCPTCGAELTRDFSENYLSHPLVGAEDTIGFYCEDCDESEKGDCYFEVPMKVTSAILTMEYDPSKIKPE